MFSVELDTSAATKALDDLAVLMADLSPIMQDIGEMLTASTRNRMEQGIAPDGSPFVPRSPATLATYARSSDPYDMVPLGAPGTCARRRFISLMVQPGYSSDQARSKPL